MKVKIGPYKNWIGPYQIVDTIFFWCKETDTEEPTTCENVKEKITDFLIRGFSKNLDHCTWFYKMLEKINNKRTRKIKIRLDPWDVWNADESIALILVPILKKFRESRIGSPQISSEDIPEYLIEEKESHEHKMKQWEWVLGEMIWAFEQSIESGHEPTESFYYFEGDPVLEIQSRDEAGFPTVYKNTGTFHKSFYEDKEGLRIYNKRREKGRELFSKYFDALWD